MTAAALRRFLDEHLRVVLVEVREAHGSTPREAGAFMLVAACATLGTIGGGQLEWLAIAQAREMLGASPAATSVTDEGATLDVPLGPEIGQCCGGRVAIDLRVVNGALRARLLFEAEKEGDSRPHALLFGAGHVGHALAAALAPLPVSVTVVETRADALESLPSDIEPRLTSVPEQSVHAAPPSSAFVVLTHDHALDFLIAAEALRRGDAAYVGMIGSRTKRNTFRTWFAAQGGAPGEFARLVCPIGGTAVRDKRPAVIAALAAAEIVAVLLSRPDA